VVLPREAARNLLYVVETATDVLVLEHAAVVSVQMLITYYLIVGSEVIASPPSPPSSLLGLAMIDTICCS